MTWTAITDGELTAGQLVLASTWKKLVDNPEAVCAGDASVPAAKLILIDGQTCPPGTNVGAILYGEPSFAEFRNVQPIGLAMPFYFWKAAGLVNWVVDSPGWYEITVQGGGGAVGGSFLAPGNFPWPGAGGSVRVHKLLTAGVTLAITVGAGAGAGNAEPSSVVGADWSIIASASPNKSVDNTLPPLSGVNSVSGVMTVIHDQPLQIATVSGNQICTSSAVGYAGHPGIVTIERISNNGI